MREFISELFHIMNYEKIEYAVLRNYENLPDKPEDSSYFDLDFFIHSNDLKRYFTLLDKLVKKNKTIVVVKRFNRQYVKHIRIVNLQNQSSVQLDGHHTSQDWHGYIYLHENEIFNHKKIYNNFFVISDFHLAIINWLDKLLWGNYVKEKYRFNIIKTLKLNQCFLEKFLSDRFGINLTNKLLIYINNSDLEGTLSLKNEMILHLRKYSLANFKCLTFSNITKFYYYELILRLCPPGLFVLIDKTIDENLQFEILDSVNILTLESDFNINNKLDYYQAYLNIRKQSKYCLYIKHNSFLYKIFPYRCIGEKPIFNVILKSYQNSFFCVLRKNND